MLGQTAEPTSWLHMEEKLSRTASFDPFEETAEHLTDVPSNSPMGLMVNPVHAI